MKLSNISRQCTTGQDPEKLTRRAEICWSKQLASNTSAMRYFLLIQPDRDTCKNMLYMVHLLYLNGKM